jgi:hypothetical protein
LTADAHPGKNRISYRIHGPGRAGSDRRYVEHIPQLRAITRTGLTVENGHAVPPETPGLGIGWDRDVMDDRRTS